MSKFSGKCDLYDTVEMISCETEKEIQEYIDRTEFYQWNNDRRVRLYITNRKELALYYPYLVSCMYGSKEKKYHCSYFR